MSADRNYTDSEQSGIDARVDRVGDVTGEPATNRAVDRNKASKLANLLEGLEFPATKEQVRTHLNRSSPAMGNRINDVLEAIENNLDERRRYESAYDVEVAAGLVERAGNESKPYVRDRALNRANSRRTGEKVRQDPYEDPSGPASARDVSPNTPKGEAL